MENTSPVRKIPILAVDDKPGNLVALEAVLGDQYLLITANSGQEALSVLCTRHDIAVILLDVQMPDMDGFETAARIKGIQDCHEIPIIFITAIYNEDPFVKKGYEVGAVDYFSKPFDPEILKMKVGIYAAHREKARFLREREQQIRESEQLLKVGRKLSSILETVPVGVIIADVEGRICQTNEEVSRIFKSIELTETDSYGEILGWWDSSGQMIKEKEGPLAKALSSGESSHNEIMQIKCFDGTTKTLFGSASPLRGMDNHIMGAVVVIQDVTESKKIEEDLEQQIMKIVSLGVGIEQGAKHKH